MTLDELRARPGYFYLASPYTKYADGHEMACFDVALLAGKLIKRGLAVFSPIAHSHTIAQAAGKACIGLDPRDHDIWLPADRPLMDGAAGMLIAAFLGWEDSFGIGAEIQVFGAAHKPIYFIDPLTLTLRDPIDDRGEYVGLSRGAEA